MSQAHGRGREKWCKLVGSGCSELDAAQEIDDLLKKAWRGLDFCG